MCGTMHGDGITIGCERRLLLGWQQANTNTLFAHTNQGAALQLIGKTRNDRLQMLIDTHGAHVFEAKGYDTRLLGLAQRHDATEVEVMREDDTFFFHGLGHNGLIWQTL